jgi:beta-glucosidase-like glycosyl hydrolase/CubicO group peptidase (beta-lactamase class C family)
LFTLLLSASLAAQDPVAALLQRMTPAEKAGQLFFCWTLSRPEGQAQRRERLFGCVREVGIGGVILSLGRVEHAAALVPQLQAAAKVPLLLAGDFEGGVAFRLEGAADMGNQMLVGATGVPALARAMGGVTGAEAKALGCHLVLAPVLDVNSNPLNPIINVRSFGSDPTAVAAFGTAFAAGVRSAGLLPCGKHFPGHGDVATDSHLLLPAVPGDRARLDAVELLPFRAAAAAGLEAVMTGHLSVPGLGEDPAVPATLSAEILGGVLREQLGFRGLIVTDALDMGGVKGALPPGEVAVRALLAGADVLLMPPDPVAARDAVLAALASDRLSMARLDDAVRRILQAKAAVGLLAGGGGVDPDWRRVVGNAAHQQVGATIAERGLVLVCDERALLPLQPGPRTLLLSLLDGDDETPDQVLAAMLGESLGSLPRARAHPKQTEPDIAQVARSLGQYERVIAAVHVKVREFDGAIGVPPVLQPVLAALRAHPHVVAVSFGSPYVGKEFAGHAAFVCAFAGTPRLERAVAAALLGRAPITGRLPVELPDVAPRGGGRSWYPPAALSTSTPEQEGLAADLPQAVAALLQQAVADRAFPGAVCAVARHGRLVAEIAAGTESWDDGARPVTPALRYDLASLTKIAATTMAVLRLAAAGRLSLDDPVQKWLPAFTGTGKERVAVQHLLAHAGGLPAYERYYRQLQGKDAIVAAAAAEGLMNEPGTTATYSDLGFVLLGAVVERCSGLDFAAFVQREVLEPLGMTTAAFAPTAAAPIDAAPTELDPARGGVVRGHVHDENAFAMGGVAGHAGLFGTARDVLQVGLCLLGGGRGLLPPALVERTRRPAGLVAGSSRALGCDLLGPGWGGTAPAAGTFGHTGFTGTSLWCDPRHDLCVVLLSNRVHPTRVNGRIARVRQQLHDLVLRSVLVP